MAPRAPRITAPGSSPLLPNVVLEVPANATRRGRKRGPLFAEEGIAQAGNPAEARTDTPALPRPRGEAGLQTRRHRTKADCFPVYL